VYKRFKWWNRWVGREVEMREWLKGRGVVVIRVEQNMWGQWVAVRERRG